MSICEGKTKWLNESSAEHRGRHITRWEPEHRPRYVYQCKICKFWHLTRMAPSPHKASRA